MDLIKLPLPCVNRTEAKQQPPMKGARIMYQKNSNGAISILLGILLAGALAGEYVYAIYKMIGG